MSRRHPLVGCVMTHATCVLQATNLSQDEFTIKIDAEEINTLIDVDYNPNKLRHIAYKPQDVMNWELQPWYQEMLSMNHLLVRVVGIHCVHSASSATVRTNACSGSDGEMIATRSCNAKRKMLTYVAC